MWNWLLTRLGLRGPRRAGPDRAVVPRRPVGAKGQHGGAPRDALSPATTLPPEAMGFFLGLVTPSDPTDFQLLDPDDRVFLSGILRRLREGHLEIPVLPQAAIEMSRLLANPNTKISEYVGVLSADPSLSVEVLRVANSAYYGFANPTESVRDAVVRVGLNQIRGLVVMAHLRGKVLQGGAFQREAAWLSDLSLGVAHLGRFLASDLGVGPDVAFTRGLLMHVEHFVILGAVADISSEHRRKIHPTEQGLLEAFLRFGPRVRALAARVWKLEGFLDAGEGDGGSSPGEPYVQMRRLLVEWWDAGTSPEEGFPGVGPDRLGRALGKVSAPQTADRGAAAQGASPRLVTPSPPSRSGAPAQPLPPAPR